MAITKEMLLANPVLKALPDDQQQALIAMSTADETKVIGERLARFWEDIDRDVEITTGERKPRETKSYDFLKQKLTALKTAADAGGAGDAELRNQVTTLTTENANLKKQIKDGSQDAALKAQLDKAQREIKDYETKLQGATGQLATQKTAHEEALAKQAAQQNQMFVDMSIAGAAASYSQHLKDGFSASDFQLIVGGKMPQLLSQYKLSVEGEGLNRQVVLRNPTTDTIITNPKDVSKALTLGDVIGGNFGSYFKEGLPGTGAGGSGGGGGLPAQLKSGFNPNGISSKVDLDNKVRAFLADKGVAAGTQEYHQQMMEVRKEALEVLPDDLPLQA